LQLNTTFPYWFCCPYSSFSNI